MLIMELTRTCNADPLSYAALQAGYAKR